MPVLIRELDIAWPMHMLPSKCCIEKSIAYKTDVDHPLNYQAWHAKPMLELASFHQAHNQAEASSRSLYAFSHEACVGEEAPHATLFSLNLSLLINTLQLLQEPPP